MMTKKQPKPEDIIREMKKDSFTINQARRFMGAGERPGCDVYFSEMFGDIVIIDIKDLK